MQNCGFSKQTSEDLPSWQLGVASQNSFLAQSLLETHFYNSGVIAFTGVIISNEIANISNNDWRFNVSILSP